MVQLKCDCMERFDTDINSLKLFEEMKSFCHNQVANGVFIEIPVSKPYHTGYSTLEQKELKWYATNGISVNHAAAFGSFCILIFQQRDLLEK